MGALINISGADAESVIEARKAIVAILKSGQDPIVTCAALASLKELCAPTSTINNCTLSGTVDE